MSDFIITVRNVSKGAFGNEPGDTNYLRVPSNVKNYSTNQAIPKKDLFKSILDEAVVGENPVTGKFFGDILVFVHGYNTGLKDVTARHRQLKSSLAEVGYEGTVVSFDWPSNDKALNYLEDRSDAKRTAIKLVDDCIRALSKIQRADCEIRVHILAHSTGAYVVREGFDDADDRAKIAGINWTVSQVMFIGADISASSMAGENPKSSSVYRHCIRLTNYYNPFDSILKLSNMKRIGVAPRVGRIGLPKSAPSKAVNVNCGDYYDEKSDSMRHVLGAKDHSWYIGDKKFTKDLFFTMVGDIDRNLIPTRVPSADGTLLLRKDE